MKGRLLLLASLLLGAAAAFHFQDRLRPALQQLVATEKDPIPLLVLEPKQYVRVVEAAGELTGLDKRPVLTPRVPSGSLKIGWLAPEGRLVRAGEVLVRFDRTDAQLQLEKNENTLASYGQQIQKNRLDAASEARLLTLEGRGAALEMDYSRHQIRRDETIFSRWEIQESIMNAALARFKMKTLEEKKAFKRTLSQSDLKILEIERARARREKLEAEKTLSSLQARAPAPGVLLYPRWGRRPLAVGDQVWPGQPLVEVAGLGSFKGELRVLETDIAGVEKGCRVALTLDALPGRTFQGRVARVGTAAVEGRGKDPRKYFSCEVVLEVPAQVMGRLRPGMRLDGRIEVGRRRRALVVPKGAVFRKDGEFTVFLSREGRFVEKQVRVLESDYGFYVIEGVEAGSRVCLRHPFQKQRLTLPDFNAPSTATRSRNFVMIIN